MAIPMMPNGGNLIFGEAIETIKQYAERIISALHAIEHEISDADSPIEELVRITTTLDFVVGTTLTTVKRIGQPAAGVSWEIQKISAVAAFADGTAEIQLWRGNAVATFGNNVPGNLMDKNNLTAGADVFSPAYPSVIRGEELWLRGVTAYAGQAGGTPYGVTVTLQIKATAPKAGRPAHALGDAEPS